tara:strand:+ start:347 stop:1363 length:1017 start_codon:yes stop_codon:yes gene_type:complete
MKKLISLKDHIFIAGAYGMVGSSIYRTFKEAGYGQKDLGGVIYAPSRNELDLLDYSSVLDWFQKFKPSVVVIAAGKVGGIGANANYPADFILENLKIQTNIIENAFKHNVKRLLFLGSSCIYPKYAKQPIKEEYLLNDSLEPTNEWYAIAKIAGIKLCQALRIQYGFDAISLMPTNLYGPGDNYNIAQSHVLPTLIRKFDEAIKNNVTTVECWGNGTPKREFMHVDDLGKACLYVLENWEPFAANSLLDENNYPLSFLNVGSGEEVTIKELTELISHELDFKGSIVWDESKPNGSPRKLLNIEKIKSIGWKPTISLKEGIKKTIINYKEDLRNKILRI